MNNTPRCLSIFVVLALAAPAWSQAYCDLRDPTTQIHQAYKNATSFRSIVRTVNAAAREAVNRRVPFGIHFNELGRHTLYIAVDGKKPIGLVHARSERSPWGLVEIAWSLDLDLRIRSFQFQRCRSPLRRELENKGLQEQLRGKSLAGLAKLLGENGKGLRPGALDINDAAASLAASVVRCGLKTIASTEAVWRRDLQSARTLQAAYAAFGKKVTTLERISRPFQSALDQIPSPAPRTPRALSGFVIEKDVELTSILDEDRNRLGLVARTPCVIGKASLVLWWTIGPDGETKSLHQEGGWESDLTRQAFKSSLGCSLKEFSSRPCVTPADAIALDVLHIATRHLTP